MIQLVIINPTKTESVLLNSYENAFKIKMYCKQYIEYHKKDKNKIHILSFKFEFLKKSVKSFVIGFLLKKEIFKSCLNHQLMFKKIVL